jgi:hypothetical protein
MLKTLKFIRKLNKNKKKNILVKNFPLPGRKEKVTSPKPSHPKMSIK